MNIYFLYLIVYKYTSMKIVSMKSAIIFKYRKVIFMRYGTF